MQVLINIIIFVVILGVIILIHEFGHFITAKFFGVYCSEFSLGMGPKIWSRKKGETDYQIRLLPIGGYVAMAGEADQEDNEIMKDVPLERTLKGIKTWKKCVIMLAGVFMNFVLSITLLIGIYSVIDVQSNLSTIGSVNENSGAQVADLKEGDVITKIFVNGEENMIASFSDIRNVLNNKNLNLEQKNLNIQVEIAREVNGEEEKLVKDVTATFNETQNTYSIGINPVTRNLSFFEAISYGFNRFWYFATVIFSTLGKLITDSVNTVGQLSGPVGIYSVTAKITATGSGSTLLSLVALLSANIGMFNLLPIPGLDGSQVLFALVEKVIGREIPLNLKYGLQLLGLALVFSLMIFVTFNDISKIFN